jgi:hypothetical protein
MAIARGNPDLLVLTLDMAVPPLSLLGFLMAGTFALAGAAALLGLSSTALIISAASLAGFALAVLSAWMTYGRDVLPPGALLSIFSYAANKLPLYRRLLSGNTGAQWIRTDRRNAR